MWTAQLLLLALTACKFLLLVNAALYESVDDLPKVKYDFIVVGGELHCVHNRSTTQNHVCLGGTAGNTIANRLTENENVSVLVLEAGGS